MMHPKVVIFKQMPFVVSLLQSDVSRSQCLRGSFLAVSEESFGIGDRLKKKKKARKNKKKGVEKKTHSLFHSMKRKKKKKKHLSINPV
jgi:hypothetical protein